MSHYETLGLQRDASIADIKRAFRRLAREHHPDRGGDSGRMQVINEAYAVLSDPERRRHYDEHGTDTPDVDPIVQEARQIVTMVFAKIIDSGGSRNVLKTARSEVAKGKQQLDLQRSSFLAQLASLQKQRGKVRARSGPNVFEGLLGQRIEAIQAQLKQADHGEQVHAAVVALLDSYECDVEPAPQPIVPPWDGTAIHFRTMP